MNYIFLGSFFEKSRTNEIWGNSKGALVASADTFQQSLLDGLTSVGINMNLLTIPAIGSFPLRYKKPWFTRSTFRYGLSDSICGGFLNITLIKSYSIYISAKKNLNKLVAITSGQRTIIVYSLLPPYLKAAVEIKKKYPDIKISCIVLDLPQYFSDQTGIASRIYSKYEQWAVSKSLPMIDSYILLTQQMAEALYLKDKPYMILEGLYSPITSRSKISAINPFEERCKIILYSGQLDNRFGISNLLDAFKKINNEEYRLWICGDGSARNDVINSAAEDSRIKYYGWMERSNVLQMQKKATILINPRNSNEDYTKYSFPSKTMEYMASGTPTIMYHLPGIPYDYFDYLAIVEGDSIDDLKNTIIEWCEKKQSDLILFGAKAKKYILENKNAKVQAARVVEFIEKYH